MTKMKQLVYQMAMMISISLVLLSIAPSFTQHGLEKERHHSNVISGNLNSDVAQGEQPITVNASGFIGLPTFLFDENRSGLFFSKSYGTNVIVLNQEQHQQTLQQILAFLKSVSNVKMKDYKMLQNHSIDKERYVGFNGIVFQVFVIGSLFIFAISHLVIYLNRWKETSAFFISIASFALATRFLFVGELSVMFRSVFRLSPETIIYTELLSGLVAVLFYYLFIDREFNPRRHKTLNLVVITVLSIYISSFIILPLTWSLQAFIIYQLLSLIVLLLTIYFSFRGVKYKIKGSYLNAFGLLLHFSLLWNDVFVYSDQISSESFDFFASLCYISILGVHLSRKSSQSFDDVEQLSTELRHLNEQLESKVKQRTAELELANQSLQKVEEDRKRLLGNIAHELNTPLTFIKGYTKAMMDEIIPKDDLSYVRSLYSETEVMEQMVTDLRELYRMESDEVVFHFQEMEISSFLEKSFQEQQVLFTNTNMKFDLKKHSGKNSDEIICYIDPIRIRQVLNNLIVNARKFTNSHGKVTMEIEVPSKENNDDVKVIISDTGIGISESDLLYIFDRFYKVGNNPHSEVRGSGLGLVVTKEIVHTHGGKIGVQSQLNEGSSFYFTIPILAK